MTGFCSNGAGPPDCYAGPKWTPNDPLFFMHHAVRIDLPLVPLHLSNHTRMVAQMIDKVWYDWQNKGPMNKYSFGGGSVAALTSFAAFTDFPTGLPPFVGVSAPSDLTRTCAITIADALRSPPLV